MLNKNIKNTLIIISIILIGIGIYYGNKNIISDEKKIENAFNNLLDKSPDNRKIFEEITKNNITIEFKPGNLQNDDLGKTIIFDNNNSNGHASVTIDLNRVFEKRDRLEPIIAHELKHIYDAYFIFGFKRFNELVLNEKDVNWWNRTLEKSAISFEDQTRQFLKTNYQNEFKGMSHKREFQNKRS